VLTTVRTAGAHFKHSANQPSSQLSRPFGNVTRFVSHLSTSVRLWLSPWNLARLHQYRPVERAGPSHSTALVESGTSTVRARTIQQAWTRSVDQLQSAGRRSMDKEWPSDSLGHLK
jgi:hypothetical protein